MASGARHRVAVVGIDGFSPIFIDRFLRDNTMPALAALRGRGAEVPLVSTIPACTPVAWAAMSTGCHPQTNGIQGFLVPRPGRPLDDRRPGVYAEYLAVEPIWQTALLNGRRSYVVKFPVSYPSDGATLRIDGAAGWGGIACLHESALAGTSIWPRTASAAAASHIAPGPAWSGEPPPGYRCLFFGRLALPNLWGKAPVPFELAIVRHQDQPLLVVATEPRWSAVQAVLAAGQWSEPIVVSAEGRSRREQHALRFKVLSIQSDPVGLALFNTSVHALHGHSHPDPLWRVHFEHAGPIEEQTDPSLVFSGSIDTATHVQRCRLNLDWLCRVSRSILTREPWDYFAVQLHFVDWAHHLLHGALDPRHPRHAPARAKEANGLLRQFYAMADELVATVVAAAGDANVIVMGDHGQDLHHTTVRLNQWLAERGLIAYGDDGQSVDWSRTRVCAFGNSLFLNRADTVPGGIVSPQQAETLVETLCRELAALSDPRTGEPVIRIVAPRRQFAELGGAGEGMGDVVFFLASGYQARNDRGALFQITEPWAEFTSGHDHFWPLDPPLQTRLYAAGPLIAPASRLAPLHSLIDVAPTIAALLGIEPSPDTEGRPIAALLAEAPDEADSKQLSQVVS